MRSTEQYHEAAPAASGAALPAGPGWPSWLQITAIGLRSWDFYDRCARRYGPAFTLRLFGGRPIVQFAAAPAIVEIFALGRDELEVGTDNAQMLEPILGSRSILLLDGEPHRRERKMMVHAFHAESFAAHAVTMTEVAEAHVARWPRSMPFASHAAMQALTLDVMLRVAFGVDDPETLEVVVPPLREFLTSADSTRIMLAIVRRGKFPSGSDWRRFCTLHERVRDALDVVIAERRADPDAARRVDVASMLIAARDEEGIGFDDDALRDELLTLLLAGHDTTATALAWAFDLLAHDPAVMAELAHAADEGDDSYLDAVGKEALRLRPVVSDVTRTMTRPTVIGEYDIPAGGAVAANLYLAHRDPELYERPTEFDPGRFLEGAVGPHAWIPFGGGVRRCLGAAFATLELRTVLRVVAQSCDLRPARAELDVPRRRAVTMVPRHGAPVILEARGR